MSASKKPKLKPRTKVIRSAPKGHAKAGVICDRWKAPTFRHYLTEAAYDFDEGPGITAETVNLYVFYPENYPQALQAVLEKCQRKCAEMKN